MERIEALAARLEPMLGEQLRFVVFASARYGCSMLEAATLSGWHEALGEILKICDISAPTFPFDLRAAMLAAASVDLPQCLQLLLDSCTASPSSLAELLGAKPSQAKDTKQCATPLIICASAGHVECMRLLLEHSPETQVMAVDKSGGTALMQAAFLGHAPCVQLLLAHSPDIQVAATNGKGATALLNAAASGQAACIELLLAHSPDTQVAAVGSDGLNALMVAAGNGHTSCVQLLLAHSPDVQITTLIVGGRSSISVAAVHGHADCLQLLLAHGPSQQQLDMALGDAGQGMSALQPPPADKQRRQGLKRCIELLLSNGAMLTAQASEGAIEAIRPISKELTALALVPGMANEAVVGLALAATGRKRQAVVGLALAASCYRRKEACLRGGCSRPLPMCVHQPLTLYESSPSGGSRDHVMQSWVCCIEATMQSTHHAAPGSPHTTRGCHF